MYDAGEILGLLGRVREGDDRAFDTLVQILYRDLRGLARVQRRRWTGDYTMNTTALVHEAYLKLVGQESPDWRDRAHFLAVAATAMRQVLVNYAERRRAEKRGGGAPVVGIDAVEVGEPFNPVAEGVAEEVIALHRALERLAERSERQSRVVECRFFAGLSIRDTAAALGVSPATVKRDWAVASAWLHRELKSPSTADR